ncbi:MAG: FAD-dependent oxidoreductase [Defluviitaleaceae bacterium]|nr:FAD-dependent oxidoreductase [Defluviitaleaceae bacterium]
MEYYIEPEKKLPVREFDVVVAGGGTGGVVAALAAARNGAKTALIEAKGYTGGIVTEGGTALHSFFNLYKEFGVEKKQVVKGIPQEIIDRLIKYGGTTGHAEMEAGYDYDSVCTAIDTEIYKFVCFEMLTEAGADIFVNTLLTGAVMDGSKIRGVIVESRSGREAFMARSFVDCTGYGDLSAYAGAEYTEPNDYDVANSMGVGGVNVEKYGQWLVDNDAVWHYCTGVRDGAPGKIVRLDGIFGKACPELGEEAGKIGLTAVITTTHDDYFMFVKLNYKMPVSPTDRDAAAKAEIELRARQMKAIGLMRKYIPGCEKAFIARTSPSIAIRRGRCVTCDFDMPLGDILEGRHFEDDVFTYGFHDCAPRLQVKNGGTYGLPYRAIRVKGIDNLLAAGMLITSDWEAHMSTRNTVACMGQGQAAGTAAAMCARLGAGTRELEYRALRQALVDGGVYLEN